MAAASTRWPVNQATRAARPLASALNVHVSHCGSPPVGSHTPLTTYETIVDRIGNVRTATGLRVRAELDAGEYPTGVTVTKEQMDALALVRDEFHGEWNYKLLPQCGSRPA